MPTNVNENDVNANHVIQLAAWNTIIERTVEDSNRGQNQDRLEILGALLHNQPEITTLVATHEIVAGGRLREVPNSWLVVLWGIAEIGYKTPPAFGRTASADLKALAPRYFNQPSDAKVAPEDLQKLQQTVLRAGGIELVAGTSGETNESRRTQLLQKVPSPPIYDRSAVQEYGGAVGGGAYKPHVALPGESDAHALLDNLTSGAVRAQAPPPPARRGPEETSDPKGRETGRSHPIALTRRLVRPAPAPAPAPAPPPCADC